MPEQQTLDPAAPEAQSGAETQPAAAEPSAPLSPFRMFAFEDVFEENPVGTVGMQNPPAAVSNESKPQAEPTATDTPDAKPAGDGVSADGEKPVEPPSLSRREQERVEHQTRIADLERQLEEAKRAAPADPAAVSAEAIAAAREEGRQSVLSEQQQQAERQRLDALTAEERADHDRYVRLQGLPTYDLTPEDRDWLDERKWLLSQPVYQAVERQIRAQVADEVRTDRARIDAQTVAFWDTVYNEVESSSQLTGVDASKWREQGHTWGAMAKDIHAGAYAAGAAAKAAELTPQLTEAKNEVEALRKENDALRAQPGPGRAPTLVGRFSSGSTAPGGIDPTRSWRTNLNEAIAEGASA